MITRGSIGYCRTHWTWFWSDRGCMQCAMTTKLRDLREQIAASQARLSDIDARLTALERQIATVSRVAHTHGAAQEPR